MKNLCFTYINYENKVISEEYETVMDFVDILEMTGIDITKIKSSNVHAIFFGNSTKPKDFNTIKELYNYCKRMLEPSWK